MTAGETHFTVSNSESVRASLKALAAKASDDGRLEMFLAAVRAIDSRLKKDPRSFGDPNTVITN